MMGPIPLIILGKVIAIPTYFAVKKYGAVKVGRVLLKTVVGTTILTSLGCLGYKGFRVIGISDEMNMNFCQNCSKPIPLEKILAAPTDVHNGSTVHIVKCTNEDCMAVNIFKLGKYKPG